jgi:uncharacterized protein (TIGR02300 family)
MAKIGTRGEKRRCQSEDCAVSFYDLNRDTFACPTCGTVFDLAADAAAKEAQRSDAGFPNRKKTRELLITAPEEGQSAVNDNDRDSDASADVAEEATTEDSGSESDDAILDEDDGDDVLADALPLSDADNDDTR